MATDGFYGIWYREAGAQDFTCIGVGQGSLEHSISVLYTR